MQASANEGCDNAGGRMQIEKVETVDFYVSAGQGQEQVQRVQVVHELHPSPAVASNTSRSILTNAAASAAATLQSAKDALSRK